MNVCFGCLPSMARLFVSLNVKYFGSLLVNRYELVHRRPLKYPERFLTSYKESEPEFRMGVSQLKGSSEQLSTVGFIGLGNMGAPMATNLLKKGHQLAVYDVVPEAAAQLGAAGATVCSGPGDVAARSSCVITMLPTDTHLLHVYQAQGGILQCVKEGTLLIDSSTVDHSTAKMLSAVATEKGAVFYDAPVSGGVGAATLGQLTFIVGGNRAQFPTVQRLLGAMGSRVLLCGPVGCGQAAKMCNNMLLAVSMVGTAEAMNLGIRLGLEPKVLMDVINSCTGRCWSSEVYNPVPGTLPSVPSANQYKGGFATKLMAKDLSIAQNAATSSHTPVSLGALAHQIYRIMVVNGYGDKDFSSVYQLLSEKKH